MTKAGQLLEAIKFSTTQGRLDKWSKAFGAKFGLGKVYPERPLKKDYSITQLTYGPIESDDFKGKFLHLITMTTGTAASTVDPESTTEIGAIQFYLINDKIGKASPEGKGFSLEGEKFTKIMDKFKSSSQLYDLLKRKYAK